MSQAKPKVVVTRRLPETIETRMTELFDVTLNLDDHNLSQKELQEAVSKANILVTTVNDRIDAKVLEHATDKLKLIAQFGTGVDNVDVKRASEKGIAVTNTPSVLTDDTADMTMALMLAVPRRIKEGVEHIENDSFPGWSPTWMLGHRITNKRLGIVGMGRIGQAVAKRAKAFGLKIHYHNRNRLDPRIEEPLEATYWADLDEMLGRVDIVSINCPHTAETNKLISKARMKAMKKDAYIVNTSRGEVVDEDAMLDLLEAGRLAGAGLDVFKNEPEANPRLKALKNVIILPHMGSATIEGRIDMGEKVLINMRAFIDGHPLPDRVLPDA